METWKAITGVIVFLIGAVVAFQSYNTLTQCSSALGTVSNFVTSIFGGTGVQACYNAQIGEYGGIIIAIIGLVIIYSANMKKGRK
ncbi:MAG: hypothetical protein ACREBF_03005 [Candidatus Micrarchaeales archaeon]